MLLYGWICRNVAVTGARLQVWWENPINYRFVIDINVQRGARCSPLPPRGAAWSRFPLCCLKILLV